MNLFKNVPRNKSYYTTMQKKRQLILKTHGWLYSKYWSIKSFIHENFLHFTSFSQNLGLISCNLFSWDLICSPHTTIKKSQESKTQDFIPSDIFSKDFEKSRTFFPKFLFPETFFPDFLTVHSNKNEKKEGIDIVNDRVCLEIRHLCKLN